MKTGIGFLALLLLSASATAAPNQYGVDGVSVGTQLSLENAAYREYKCSPSEQFAGLTWCQKTKNNKERRGPYTAAYSVLHSRDGKVLYVNRSQDPAFFTSKEAESEIQRYSRSIGEPRITKMPNAGRNGIIAVWGDVTLEQLDEESIRTLAEGKSPKKGLLIDFLANLARSAKEGLPVYRIGGGPGFIWASSFDQKGRGTLRTVAVDASGFVSSPFEVAPKGQPVAQSAAESVQAEPKPVELAGAVEKVESEPEIARSTIAELEKADGEEARIAAGKVSVDAENANRELEQADSTQTDEIDGTIAQSEVAQSEVDGSRWEKAFYASMGGLFGALFGFAFGFFLRRQKAAGAKEQIGEPAMKAVETSVQCQSVEAKISSPALSPEISETALENALEAQVVAINANAAQNETECEAAQSVPESPEKVPAPALV
jgi:hypothetical protein